MLWSIQADSAGMHGRIEVRDINAGEILKQFNSGIDPTGQFAILPNEAEEFILDRESLNYHTTDRSITLIKLHKNPNHIRTILIELPNLTGLSGAAHLRHGRYIEREIDWNNDGEIDKGQVIVGKYSGI